MSFSSLRMWTTAGLALLLTLGTGLPLQAQSRSGDLDRVRVRLQHGSALNRVELTAEDGPVAVHVPGGSSPVMRLQSGETATLGVRQQDVYVRTDANGLYGTKLNVRPRDTDAAWTLSFETDEERTYTGELSLAPSPDQGSGLMLVNNVSIENYVASVVASEYSLDDREGAKAMAVVARTYGLFTSAKFGGAYDHADGTASQVYEGSNAVTEASRRAAEATAGEVLTYDGNLIQAVYFSSSGGHTANNESVWEGEDPIPYLRGKDDPYDSESPHHSWTSTVNRSELLQALTRERGTPVDGFTIHSRTSHGRVETVELLQSNNNTHVMDATDFRFAVNRDVQEAPLKSTWFDARRQGAQYVFDGRGFGHGVGLSQYGAHAMAEQGADYREILRFYYTDVEIERLDGVEFVPEEAPVANEPDVEKADTTERRIGW